MHFQCDKCPFRKIQGRDPDALSEKYMRLFVAIRRANVDAFWSRELVKVKVNLTMVKSLGKVTGD